MEKISIFGIEIDKLTNESFLEFISSGINDNKRLTIGYANADTLNKAYESEKLRSVYKSFDLIHPDGTGIYLASRILYGKDGLDKRLTGSDFYPVLINESIDKNWSYFFFGHRKEVLEQVKIQYPSLNISGTYEGYDYNTTEVIDKINEADPDIIIIGLSCPYQENWIFENKDKIKFKVILAVGDGIRVFAKNKIRGPVIFRKLGIRMAYKISIRSIFEFQQICYRNSPDLFAELQDLN